MKEHTAEEISSIAGTILAKIRELGNTLRETDVVCVLPFSQKEFADLPRSKTMQLDPELSTLCTVGQMESLAAKTLALTKK